MLGLLLTCVYVINSPVQSKYIHTLARACLNMKAWHAISEVVQDLCSINSADKLVETVTPSLNFFQLLLPYMLGNTLEIKSILFGNIPLRQMDHISRTKKPQLKSSLKKKINYLTCHKGICDETKSLHSCTT